MGIGLSGDQFGLESSKWQQNIRGGVGGGDLFFTSMITDWIGRNEVLLPINHKAFSFREKNSQFMKERKHLH